MSDGEDCMKEEVICDLCQVLSEMSGGHLSEELEEGSGLEKCKCGRQQHTHNALGIESHGSR